MYYSSTPQGDLDHRYGRLDSGWHGNNGIEHERSYNRKTGYMMDCLYNALECELSGKIDEMYLCIRQAREWNSFRIEFCEYYNIR